MFRVFGESCDFSYGDDKIGFFDEVYSQLLSMPVDLLMTQNCFFICASLTVAPAHVTSPLMQILLKL